MSKRATRKLTNAIAMMLATIMLILQSTCMEASAAETTERYTVTAQDEVVATGNTESQQLKLVKGKTYIFAYPIFNSKDWKIAKLEYNTKAGEWKSLELKEVVSSNDDLQVQECEIGPGKLLLKLVCLTDDIAQIKANVKNLLTGEVREFAASVDVGEHQETETNSQKNDWKVEKDRRRSRYLPLVTPAIPSEPEKPTEPTEPEKPSDIVIVVPPEKEDEEPKLVVIDTSSWKFNPVRGTYSGNDFIALVEGIPEELRDIVKLEYINNSRTNAGSQTAYVKFSVPDGYKIISGMETTIDIDKAKFETSFDRYSYAYTEDGIRFEVPNSDIPEGVDIKYVVNGVEYDNTYAVTDTGVYNVIAKFDSENYKADDAKAVYYVKPPILGDTTKYKVMLDRKTDEPCDENGEIKVLIWVDYKKDDVSLSDVNYFLRYDTNVLEYVSNTAMIGGTFVTQHPYSETSSGYGGVMVFGGEIPKDQYGQSGLVTLTFKLKDTEAKDIAINLTGIYGSDSNDMLLKHNAYCEGLHLLRQADTEVYGVNFNKLQTKVQSEEASANDVTQVEKAEAETLNVSNDSSEDEQTPNTEATAQDQTESLDNEAVTTDNEEVAGEASTKDVTEASEDTEQKSEVKSKEETKQEESSSGNEVADKKEEESGEKEAQEEGTTSEEASGESAESKETSDKTEGKASESADVAKTSSDEPTVAEEG